jgi:integrase/recombinase XerD
MELKEYLNKHTAPSTADRYIREINRFFVSAEIRRANSSDKTSGSAVHPKDFTYSQIIAYIGERREQFQKSSSIGCTLHAIKHYYSYLVETGERKDNPAKSIILRDKRNRQIQIQDLFTPEELELLLDRKERYKILKNRNLLVLSLFIYQGLANREIKNLEISDIDLKEAKINIKASGKNNGRVLKLNAKQMYFLMNYLNEDRPVLLRTASNKLIISSRGTAETGEGIHYIVETSKDLFPTKNLNPVTIRQSVISNLLKAGNDLRLVQAFAGHKYPSATENYKQNHLEELKNQVLKHHPLQ